MLSTNGPEVAPTEESGAGPIAADDKATVTDFLLNHRDPPRVGPAEFFRSAIYRVSKQV